MKLIQSEVFDGSMPSGRDFKIYSLEAEEEQDTVDGFSLVSFGVLIYGRGLTAAAVVGDNRLDVGAGVSSISRTDF